MKLLETKTCRIEMFRTYNGLWKAPLQLQHMMDICTGSDKSEDKAWQLLLKRHRDHLKRRMEEIPAEIAAIDEELTGQGSLL